MECMNPGIFIATIISFIAPQSCESYVIGGTGKDRASKMMLMDAMATGKLPASGGIVVEGTSGRWEAYDNYWL